MTRSLLCSAAAMLLLIASPLPAQTPEFIPVRVVNVKEAGEAIGQLYPQQLRAQEISGFVVLELDVSARGDIERRWVLVSSGVHAFDRAALRVTQMLRLEPALRNGVPVPSRTRIPITFQGKPKKGMLHLKQARALNADTIRQLGSAHFPAELSAQQLNALVGVTLELDRHGNVTQPVVSASSCLGDVDSAALELARVLRFAPLAAPGAERAQVNVTLRFQSDSVYVRVAGDTLRSDTVPRRPFAPTLDRKPELVNRSEIALRLQTAYPPRAEDEQFEALVWLLIDEQGNVARRQLQDTTGDCWADVRVLDVLKTAKFQPALRDNERVAVWIQLPVILKSQ